MTIATTIPELRKLADARERYADALLALFVAIGAHDLPPGSGEQHAIYVGPPREAKCLFRGHLNITREKILPRWKNAHEIAFEATIERIYGEVRDRQSGKGDFVIKWVKD